METFVADYFGGKLLDALFSNEELSKEDIKMIILDSHIAVMYLSRRLINLARELKIPNENRLLTQSDRGELIKELDNLIEMTKGYSHTNTFKIIFEHWKELKSKL